MTQCSESVWAGGEGGGRAEGGGGLLTGPGSASLSLWEARKLQNISKYYILDPPTFGKCIADNSSHFADPVWRIFPVLILHAACLFNPKQETK